MICSGKYALTCSGRILVGYVGYQVFPEHGAGSCCGVDLLILTLWCVAKHV